MTMLLVFAAALLALLVVGLVTGAGQEAAVVHPDFAPMQRGIDSGTLGAPIWTGYLVGLLIIGMMWVTMLVGFRGGHWVRIAVTAWTAWYGFAFVALLRSYGGYDLGVTTIVAGGSNVSLNSGDLTLDATSTTATTTHAKPDDSGAGAADLGMGASVAISVADNLTRAGLEDTATLTSVDDLTLSATGSHTTTTTADGGGTGGSGAVGGAVAIAVVDNSTTADLGTDTTALDITGNLTATATHHGVSTTTADGTALGGECCDII